LKTEVIISRFMGPNPQIDQGQGFHSVREKAKLQKFGQQALNRLFFRHHFSGSRLGTKLPDLRNFSFYAGETSNSQVPSEEFTDTHKTQLV